MLERSVVTLLRAQVWLRGNISAHLSFSATPRMTFLSSPFGRMPEGQSFLLAFKTQGRT